MQTWQWVLLGIAQLGQFAVAAHCVYDEYWLAPRRRIARIAKVFE
jgi:hypothetical protein